jgi:uncharacterized membrane protein
MSEFVFDDGRKAERVENNPDPLTKVTEVYVEPKMEKKLAKRVTERLCVCEREIETLDESTGEVVERVIEKVCEGRTLETKKAATSSNVMEIVEKRVSSKKNVANYIFIALVALQVAVLAYVMFGM